MGNRSPSCSAALSIINSLPAFVLSAVLAVGFVGVVNKTHDLFCGAGCEQQTVLVNEQPQFVLYAFGTTPFADDLARLKPLLNQENKEK